MIISKLNLAEEAVFVILVVIKDSDLQYFMHIADIPEMLTNSLAEHFDSTYKEKQQYQLGSKVLLAVGVLGRVFDYLQNQTKKSRKGI